MKFLGIVFGIVVVLALVAFIAIAMIDVPVAQTEVSKTVPNDQFYNQGATP